MNQYDYTLNNDSPSLAKREMALLDEYTKLCRAIKEKAVQIAHDYPEIGRLSPYEHLWAITSSYEGTDAANKDCHLLIDHLREKLGMTKVELTDLWINLRSKAKVSRKE